MSDAVSAKCSCQACGVHIEFPVELNASTIACPQCGEQTLLSVPGVEADSAPELHISTITGAFGAAQPKKRPSVLYQISLLFVTVAMILLPVIYVALIGAAAVGVWWWATHFSFLLHPGRGARLYLMQVAAFITPLVAGCVVAFFLIKPLFARRKAAAQPLALNPGAEPLLYTFIHQIAKSVGSPTPSRIDLDCNLNASAHFRRGFWSMFGNDLVLTIGLPLVAGLNTRQFAGVIAHEFGHFTQGFGMRLTYIIRSVNGWFARVAYERDAWDQAIEDWAADCEDGRVAILIGLVQFSVWSSRLVLKALMYVGHFVGCMALRQMEYDADRSQINLAGSACFEETARRVHVLGRLLDRTYKDLRPGWNTSRELPDNFSSYLLRHDADLPELRRTQLEDTLGLETSGLFDTHPSWGDRIRRARQARAPGIFELEKPAPLLFSNFEVPARQVTILHYTEDMGIPAPLITLVSVDDRKKPVTPAPAPIVEPDRPVYSGPWKISRS